MEGKTVVFPSMTHLHLATRVFSKVKEQPNLFPGSFETLPLRNVEF